MDNFSDIKEAYTAAREQQRRRIIDYLAEQKDSKGKPIFKNPKGIPYTECRNRYSGGKGIDKYGRNRLEPAYNLQNWKYVETQYLNRNVLISLQCFDIDPGSGNIHTMYDRIGLYFYADGTDKPGSIKIYADDKSLRLADCFLKTQTTQLELPLSDGDLSELISLITDGVRKIREN